MIPILLALLSLTPSCFSLRDLLSISGEYGHKLHSIHHQHEQLWQVRVQSAADKHKGTSKQPFLELLSPDKCRGTFFFTRGTRSLW